MHRIVRERGFTLIEIIVALAILVGWFAFTFPALVSLFRASGGREGELRAHGLAQDGMEAVKNIRDRNWAEILSTTGGVAYHAVTRSGEWQLDPGATTTGSFTSELLIDPVLRDGSGNIVSTTGSQDPFMRSVRSRVTWSEAGATSTEVLANYVTHWGAMKNYVSFMNQTNLADFRAGTLQNADVLAVPGSVTLARRMLYSENFEGAAPGAPVADWTSTRPSFSLTATTALFFAQSASTTTIGTTSTQTSIHTHYTGAGASRWTDYEVSGRMMVTNPAGGLGITFTSLYATTDRYYAVALNHPDRNAGCIANSFCLVARGTSLAGMGVQDYQSEVGAQANQWYRFRITARNVSNQTLLTAKVWSTTSTEPLANVIDHYDGSASHTATGTIGIFATGSGSKYVDDLEVRSATAYEPSGTYVSPPFDAGGPSLFDLLAWDVRLPAGTTVGLQLRSATTSALLASQSWYGPTSTADRYQTNPSGETVNIVHNGHEWVQYRVFLDTTVAASTPVFNEIRLSYVPK